MERILLASDHGGYEIKQEIKKYLEDKGYDVIDKGNTFYDEDDDYPDFAISATMDAVSQNIKAILFCKTGVGVCICANKVKGALAVHGYSKRIVKKSREDEDANVLCIGAKYLKEKQIKSIIDTFLETKFSQIDRHKRRISKIHEFESYE